VGLSLLVTKISPLGKEKGFCLPIHVFLKEGGESGVLREKRVLSLKEKYNGINFHFVDEERKEKSIPSGRVEEGQ